MRISEIERAFGARVEEDSGDAQLASVILNNLKIEARNGYVAVAVAGFVD